MPDIPFETWVNDKGNSVVESGVTLTRYWVKDVEYSLCNEVASTHPRIKWDNRYC